MEVWGYKAFNKDKTNNYGMQFEEGKSYAISGNISPGLYGKSEGYHFCTNLADVFRFVDAKNDDVQVAYVGTNSEYVKFDDEYYGYFDMVVCREIYIDRFLTREEIIDRSLEFGEFDLRKFLSTIKLDDNEILKFIKKYDNRLYCLRDLLYYQADVKDVFSKNDITQDVLNLRKVLEDGQNSNKGSKRE